MASTLPNCSDFNYFLNINNQQINNMNISHIEHIGIAVKNIDEAIKYYEDVLGLKCYAVEEVADQKVKTAFFMVGQTKLNCSNQLLLMDQSENLLKRKVKEFITLHLQ